MTPFSRRGVGRRQARPDPPTHPAADLRPSRPGRDEQIPMELFVQAWAASGDLMAVTT